MSHNQKPRVGRLRRNPVCKVLMVVLYLFSLTGVISGILLSVLCLDMEIYDSDLAEIEQSSMESLCFSHVMEANDVYQNLINNGYYEENLSETLRGSLYDQWMGRYDPSHSNFFFTVQSPDQEILLQNYTDEYQYCRTEYFYSTEYHTTVLQMTQQELDAYEFPVNSSVEIEEMYTESAETQDDVTEAASEEGGVHETAVYEPTEVSGALTESAEITDETAVSPMDTAVSHYLVTITVPEETLDYYVTGYVRKNLTADDTYRDAAALAELVWKFRYASVGLIVAGIIGLWFSVWFLLSGAGYHAYAEEAQPSFFDRIPLDLFSFVHVMAMLAIVVIFDECVNGSESWMTFLACVACGVVAALLILFWLASTTVRLRTGTAVKNNLIVKLFLLLGKGLQKAGDTAQMLPVIWQAPAVVGGFCFLQFIAIVMIADGNFLGAALCVLIWTVIIILSILIVLNMHYLEKGAAELAKGKLEHKIPEHKLIGPFRSHAVNLNSISDGMNQAVGDRIKSEMFKTELIANVSHDIRTPLTSIVNYTDLLAKLELDDPQAQEYIDVLMRQSARLRKLTEDVLEASKASTGNITVERGIMDLRVLLEQMLGEYEEKLTSKQLQMVCSIPDTPLYIMADGRLMWRIMDNLFSNIYKYAMPQTRVYLDANAADKRISVVLRNISGSQLNMPVEALLERFVQGDRSRNTEGSGLGLSIAQSLTEIQGGTFRMEIDGDLFKVILSFAESDTNSQSNY